MRVRPQGAAPSGSHAALAIQGCVSMRDSCQHVNLLVHPLRSSALGARFAGDAHRNSGALLACRPRVARARRRASCPWGTVGPWDYGTNGAKDSSAVPRSYGPTVLWSTAAAWGHRIRRSPRQIARTRPLSYCSGAGTCYRKRPALPGGNCCRANALFVRGCRAGLFSLVTTSRQRTMHKPPAWGPRESV